jgi:hypothetical protein
MNSFKNWLKLEEAGTATSSVAVFKMPLGIGMVRRTWPIEEKEKNKKKR